MEAGSLRSGCQCGCYSGSSPGCRQLTSGVSSYGGRTQELCGGPLLGADSWLPAYPHMEEGAQDFRRVLIWKRGSGALWGPFYRSTNPILKALVLTIPQRPRLLIPTIGFQWFCTDLLRASIFLYMSFCKIMSFKELIHFIQVFKFVGIELFIILFKYYPFTTQGISSDGPFISNTRNLYPLFFLS